MRALGLTVSMILALVACQAVDSSPQAPTVAASPAPTGSRSPSPAPVPSIAPSASPGFAFDPESVAGYYTSIGYTCGERQPSSQATGYEFQSCQLVDPAGRTRTVGFVTDPDDDLADAFMTIRGAPGEAVLEPAAVLEPFAGFLGAILGEAHGSAILPWLAGALGDPYQSTTLGELTIATYTDAPDDHATLSVEIANQGYLDSPRPSVSATP